MIGQTFHYLYVIRFDHARGYQKYYLCRCLLCGTKAVKRGSSVASGHTKSCGCFNRVPRAPLVAGESPAEHRRRLRSATQQRWRVKKSHPQS